MRNRLLTRWIYVIAVLAPVAAAAVLIPIRDDVDNTNVALLLVVVVVAVASVGVRTAAAVAALSAAASFNFFHTVPYYSLRIDSRDDVETAALLLLVGLAVGELASRGLQAQAAAARGRRDLASLHGLGALVAKGEDADYVLHGRGERAHPPARPGRMPLRDLPRPTMRCSRSSRAMGR